MDLTILKRIGLSNGPVKVYLAMLELGDTTSGPIIKSSNVAASKVYEILEKLKDKGLISEKIQEKTKHFQANSPKRLLDYINNKEKQIAEEKKLFEKILPTLEQKQKEKLEPQEARVYVGFEGIKSFYEDMADGLSKKEEYLGFAFPKHAFGHKYVVRLFDKFHHKRAVQGGKSKLLFRLNDKINKHRMAQPLHKLYEFRMTSQAFPSGVSIFKDTVATFTWDKIPRVFAITSKENANEYKSFFYALWEKAKKH